MPTSEEWVSQATATPVETPAPVTDTPTTATETAAPTETAAAPSETPSAGDTQAQIEALEAWLDEQGTQKLSIPLSARVPITQYGKQEYVPLKDALANHLFHRDYTKRSQAMKVEREAFERQRKEAELDRAALEAERAMWEEDRERLRRANEDPEEMERYVDHVNRLRSDPTYKKLVDDALAHRTQQVRAQKEEELDQYDKAVSVTQDALAYIEAQRARYPGVDPERVRTRLATGLANGALRLHAVTVDQLFQDEADYLAKATSPVTEELKSLREQIAALQAVHKNAQVVQGIKSSHQPVTSSPLARDPATGRFTPHPGETRETATQRWAAVR
jgi:hypothetical protein